MNSQGKTIWTVTVMAVVLGLIEARQIRENLPRVFSPMTDVAEQIEVGRCNG